jgi:GT2 family glycosyltransferase
MSRCLQNRVGIVVPTRGERPEYFQQCIQSIRDAGDAVIIVVAPESKFAEIEAVSNDFDLLVRDPGRGLAAAINQGVMRLPEEITYFNWLGDDDLLEPNSLTGLTRTIQNRSNVVLLFGFCRYINNEGKQLWANQSGVIGSKIIRFGPCLIPQPGALIQRAAFEDVGKLNEKLGWAFDLDLFIRLKSVGKISCVPEFVSSFRWHSDSLSVRFRKNSAAEASLVRRSYLSKPLRIISPIWERPVKFLTIHARFLVEFKL